MLYVNEYSLAVELCFPKALERLRGLVSTQVLRPRPAINKQISFRFSVRLFIIGLGTRAKMMTRVLSYT